MKTKKLFAGVLILLALLGVGLLDCCGIRVWAAEPAPAITADCSDIQREVDPCMFGYIRAARTNY